MEWLVDVKGDLKKRSWRYGLKPGRYEAMPRRFCGDVPRTASTRRHTEVTNQIYAGENMEKSSSNRVNSPNQWDVFRCSEYWARARPKTALISSGAPESSAVWPVVVVRFQVSPI